MKLKSTYKTPIGIALALGMDYIDDTNDPRLFCKIEAARVNNGHY